MAYTTGNSILAQLPPLKGKVELLVDNQDVDDIIKAVLESHKLFADHYDHIWQEFYNEDIEHIGKDLFNFCYDYIHYKVESDKRQTVKSPAAILLLGSIIGGDCKHYASFIGGVLDSIQRNTGKKIDWKYRFASYDWWDSKPEHVFIVVNSDKKNEFWIDPVLNEFDQRDPDPKWIYDKKPKMALVRISGINDHPARIGIAPVVAAALIATIPSVGAFVASLFGGRKEPESTGVRTLVALFRNNVAGNPTALNEPVDGVSVQEADQAQAWFTAVLGIPIYDIYRWYALAGLAPNKFWILKDRFTGELKTQSFPPLNDQIFGSYSGTLWMPARYTLSDTIDKGAQLDITDSDRIVDYKEAAGPDAIGFTDAQILQAIQIAKYMQSNPGVGRWKNLTVAPSSVNDELIQAYNAANPDKPIDITDMPVTTNNSISDIIKANPLATAGIAAVGAWGIYSLTKPKKKMGKIDNNTILYVGLGAAAVYLLTRNKTSSNVPVYQPYPNQYYPTNSNNQANVWSFLDSLADLAAGIFVKKPSAPIYHSEP